jgi:threonylcarbamoyladenosine tRNA methylthiotransferase MtaB
MLRPGFAVPPAARYRFVTLGCKLNQADSAGIEARLRALGMTRAGEETAADLVVLNTCTVTHLADREARQIARRLRRANPGATLVATGCSVTRDPEALRAAAGIDHLVPLADQDDRIPAIAAALLGLPADAGGLDLGDLGATAACGTGPGPADRTRAFLKIQDGCDLRCAYCIIPQVRGASRSVPPGAVVDRLRRLIDAGVREVVFTGVNTGDYGRDLDPPLALLDLLRRAVAIPGLGRIRLNSLEPKTVTADLVAFLAGCGGAVAPHLQVPLQSGCDTVLARMRRNYRIADYARAIETLRSAVPGIGLGADVIVGFPGETAAEFDSTCRFIESAGLHYLHVFSWSPRPGTPAATLPGALAPAIVRDRSARLRALGHDLSLRFRRSCVGSERDALILRATRGDGTLRALTDNFIDLTVDGPGGDPATLENRIVRVRIVAATGATTRAVLAPGGSG